MRESEIPSLLNGCAERCTIDIVARCIGLVAIVC
jgi:hypothetical protein